MADTKKGKDSEILKKALVFQLLLADFRLHLLHARLYAGPFDMTRLENECSMLSSCNFQMCLLSSMEFLRFGCLNVAVWFLYLVLKLFSVSPTYVSVVRLSMRVTMAW